MIHRHSTQDRFFPKDRIVPLLFAAMMPMLPSARAGITPGSKNLGAIWFVGDSITQSNADGDANGSPRKSLYDLLTANGYTFSYTGHFAANVDGLPATGGTPETNLYHYHSGVSGSVIADTQGSLTGMTQNLSGFWSGGRLATVKPDVILIMLGTNDVNQPVDPPNAPARLIAFVNAVFAQPGVGNPTVFIATIPPNRTNVPLDPENVAIFNAALPGVVDSLRAAGKDVHLVDCFTPINEFYPTAMVSDNLHPSATGNSLIAQGWLNGIAAIADPPATRIKAATGTDLSAGASWDVLPTASDIAAWSTGSLGGPLTLGSAQTWGAIDIGDATAPLLLSGSPLTLNAGPVIGDVANTGIRIAAEGKDVSIANGITLAGNQTWVVGAGRTLTTTGATSGAFTLKYSGEGGYVVDGINTANKSVIIDAATVRVNPGKSLLAASALQSGTNVLVQHGGVLEGYSWDFGSGNLFGQTADATNALMLDGGGTLRMMQSVTSSSNRGITVGSGGGRIDVVSGATFNWQTGAMTSALNGVLTVDGEGAFTFSRPVAWGAGGGLTKSGTGALNMTAPVAIGSGGVFTGNDGTFTNTSVSGITIANGGNAFISGGTYSFTGTTGWAANNGTYTQTGGTVNISQNGFDGVQPATATSSMSVTGGVLNIIKAAGYINISNNGTGNLTIGGTGTVDTHALYFMHPSLAVGTGKLNLNAGGTLVVNTIVPGGNTAVGAQTFNWNGGVLKAKSASFGTWANSTRVAVKVQAGGAVVDSNGQTMAIGQVLGHDPALGVIADGGLTKTGEGTLTLSGNNTYTGTTTVSAGTLVVGIPKAVSTSQTIQVDSGATLQDGTFGAGQTVQGTGTLAGSMKMAASSNLEPAGAGAIGTLNVSGALTLEGQTHLDLSKSGSTLASDRIEGAGSVSYGGTLVVSATGDPLGLGDTFTLFGHSGGSSGSFTSYVLPPLPSGLSWDRTNLPVDGTLSVVNFLGAPTFDPPTGSYVGSQSVTITSDPGATIYYTTDGSTPTTSSPSGLSPVTGIPVPAGASMILQAFAVKTGQPAGTIGAASYLTVPAAIWNVDASGLWSGAGNWFQNAVPDAAEISVDFYSTPQSADATVTLDSDRKAGNLIFGNANPANWLVNATGGSVLTLDAQAPTVTVLDHTTNLAVALAGSNGLVKNGAGTLVLSGANFYAGDTIVEEGPLTLGAANVIPDGPGKGDLRVSGTFDLNTFSETVNGLRGSGTVDKFVAGSATLSVGAGDTSSNFDGVIQNTLGTVALAKTGSGTFALTNIHTYSGNTTVTGGTLEIPTGASIGTATSGKVEVNAGTLRLSGGSITGNGNGASFLGLTGASTFDFSSGSLTLNAANQYWEMVVGQQTPGIWNQTGGTANLNIGSLYLANNPGTGGTALNLSGGTFSINGATGTSDRMIIISVRANASVTLSGTIDATIPRIQFGHTPAVTPAAAVGTFNLDGGILRMTSTSNPGTRTAIFNLNGGLLEALADSTTFIANLTTANVRNGGARIDSNGHDITISQSLVHSGIAGDAAIDGGLTKSGAGKVTLTGANSYTGPTAVNDGSLQVDGSITQSSVTVVSGATLGGVGTLGGSSTVVAGTLAPGATGPGTLSTGDLHLNGIYECEVAGNVSDKVVVAGDLDLNGSTIHMSEASGATAFRYVIATYSGTLAPFTTPPIFSGSPGFELDVSTPGEIALVNTTSGYAAWADSWSDPALTDKTPGGDPDGDGIQNLLEYVLGGDPRVSSRDSLPTVIQSGGNLILGYKRSELSKLDTIQVGQWSTNLVDWTDVVPEVADDHGANPDDMTVTVPLSLGSDGKLFLRLKVTR